MDSVYVWFLLDIFSFSYYFCILKPSRYTDLLCHHGGDGVGVSVYSGVELQQVLYVDWLFAHQLARQRICLIRYRRHLSAGGGFQNYISNFTFNRQIHS